jgi:hypothetical protein
MYFPFSVLTLFVEHDVQHLVIEDIFDDILGNQGLIQPSTQRDCPVGRIILPECAAALRATPSEVIDLHAVLKILSVKIRKKHPQIEHFALRRAQLLAASLGSGRSRLLSDGFTLGEGAIHLKRPRRRSATEKAIEKNRHQRAKDFGGSRPADIAYANAQAAGAGTNGVTQSRVRVELDRETRYSRTSKAGIGLDKGSFQSSQAILSHWGVFRTEKR